MCIIFNFFQKQLGGGVFFFITFATETMFNQNKIKLMTKKLHLFLLCTFALLFGSASAQKVVTFDATNPGSDQFTITTDGVTLSIEPGTNSSAGTLINGTEYRIYKGAILNLSSTEGNIEKVVFTCTANNTTKYGPGCFVVADGTYTYENKVGTWVGSQAAVSFTASSNQVRATKVEVTLAPAGENYVAAPTIKGKAKFLETAEVTVTAGEGAAIYYTLDGTEPTAASTLYEGAITLTETATVKAVAVEGDVLSEVVEATFTKVVPEELAFADLCNLTADKKEVKVNFNGVVVAFVDGSTVHLREGENAAALYNIGRTFTQGEVLQGHIVADFKLYNSLPELVVNNDLTDVNTITISEKPAEVAPYKVTVADLNAGKWMGHYVVLSNATVETETVDDKTTTYIVQGEDKIACYKGIDLTAFVGTGLTYDIEVLFNSIYKGTPQVKPLFIEEYVEVTPLELVSVDPADGAELESVSKFTFTFNKPVTLGEEGGVVLYVNGSPVGQLWGEVSEADAKVVTFVTEKEISNSGKYMLYVAPATFVDADGNTNEEMMLNYQVKAAVNSFTYAYVTPAQHQVQKSLKVLTIGFIGEVQDVVSSKSINVVDAEGKTVTTAKLDLDDYDWNAVIVTFKDEITAPGQYSITIPEEYVFSWEQTYNPEFTLTFTIEGEEEEETVDYTPLHTGTKTNTGRNISVVKLTSALGENVYELSATEQTQDYTDATAVATFKVIAGEEVTPSVQYGGTWMHHAVFVDFDADGFTGALAEGSEWEPAGDLVAYSFYNNGSTSDEFGWNSVGQSISGDNRANPTIPAFTAPAEPGTYRMRFVQDWCSIDPAGDNDGKFSDFKANGGQIVDVILEVGENTGIEAVATKTSNKVYTIDGRMVNAKAGDKLAKGLYIVGGKKIYVK